jgi:hypothetical protein
MIGYGNYGSWGGKYKSTSGWEKSHFGGFNRILSDYPFIKLGYEVDIKPGEKISKELGSWLGEKLIKLYILKLKELDLIKYLKSEEVEREGFFGKTKRYSVISLHNESILDTVCSTYTEFAPLFEHFKKDIFESSIEMEITDKDQEGDCEGGEEGEEGENEEKKDGEGQGQGEGDQENDKKKDGQGEGEGEGEGKPGNSKKTSKTCKGKTITDYINEINESKPFSRNSDLSEFGEKPIFSPFDKKRDLGKVTFTPKQKQDAEMLIKLLDINFDPKSDVVKNLKLGTLDTSKIAEVPAGNISVYKQTLEEQDTKPFSVCVLADMSGSMGNGSRIPSQLHILNTLYLALSQILPVDKLYIYGHSGSYTPEIYTFYSPYDTEYEKNIQYYQKVDWAQNYDGPVIESIHKKVRETNDDRIIFISLSDGDPCGNNYGSNSDVQDLKRILERARRDEFVTVGIGIESDHVNKLYSYSKAVWDLGLLPKEVSSIINQVVRSEFK